MYPDGMPDDRGSYKRPGQRERVQMAVTFVLEGDEAKYLAKAVDISPYGLRLQSNVTLAPGQPVGLLLATEPARFIKARVVWVGRADSAQAGQAGFQFLNPLTTPVC